LQRARQVDRRPTDMKQAFVEAGRGHIIFTLSSWLPRKRP
jgi:hypothetical protein